MLRLVFSKKLYGSSVLTLLLLFQYSLLYAQHDNHLHGMVVDDAGYPLIGATVRWVNGPGTTTDIDGNFHLDVVDNLNRIAFSFIGFATSVVHKDSVSFPIKIILKEIDNQLLTVEVNARDKGSRVSTLADRNVESLSSKELKKAPCCTLAESFENSPVVDLSYGDPLTGRREIQMLGLRANYTLLTLEKRPLFQGLASPYAFDMIPGTWVSGIQIGKGAASLESSAAGLNGQINTELQKPHTDAPLFINLFGGSQGRGEANVHLNHQLTDVVSAGAYLHGSFTSNKHDHDYDRFKDMPDRNTQSALLRLFRNGTNTNWEGQWNIFASRDERKGGQQNVHNHGQASLDPYIINQDNKHLSFFGKTGYFGFKKPHQSAGIIYSANLHQLNNLYGRTNHIGEQKSAYLNALYHTRIDNDNHKIALGFTGQIDNISERLGDRIYDRKERTVGTSLEYTLNWEQEDAKPYQAFTAILGFRVDYHNLGQVQASPRINIKYNPREQTAIRFSAGRGWRSPSVLVENLNFLPSSRTINLAVDATDNENPGFAGLETAWNFGANVTQQFTIFDRSASIVLDYFHTRFQNQIVLDIEQDKDNLFLYQLDGQSFSNSAMFSFSYELIDKLDFRATYKYNDVRTTYRAKGLRQLPLSPNHRALASLDYDGRRFRVNVNYQWTGQQRLPDHGFIPSTVYLPHPQTAPSFGLINAQLTFIANSKSEFYGGVENITNVTQRNAIIGAWEPFDGGYFDASQVYQPLFERRFFLGWRYSLR